MKARAIAQKATDLVGGDRKEAYGDVVSGLTRIAIYWNAELHATSNAPPRPLTAADVAKLMVLMKLARADTGPLRMDNFIDMAGWAAIAGEAAARTQEVPEFIVSAKPLTKEEFDALRRQWETCGSNLRPL